MVVRSDSIITIYGAFYQGGSRITELEDKAISCVLLNMEGIEIKEFNDITTAEDGSVCVKIQPNTIPSGRYYYHITLKREDGTIIATIKNEMEVIMVNDDNDICGDEECDSRITPFFAVASALQSEVNDAISAALTPVNTEIGNVKTLAETNHTNLGTLQGKVNANAMAIAQLEAATINGMTLVDEEGNAKQVNITLANLEYDGTTGKDSSYPTFGAINAWEAVDMLSNSIKTLNGNAETVGSVDHKIAQAFKWIKITT